MKPKLTTRLSRGATRGCQLARSIILAVATPLLEKNPDKASTAPWYVPMVFSMARVIVVAPTSSAPRKMNGKHRTLFTWLG